MAVRAMPFLNMQGKLCLDYFLGKIELKIFYLVIQDGSVTTCCFNNQKRNHGRHTPKHLCVKLMLIKAIVLPFRMNNNGGA